MWIELLAHQMKKKKETKGVKNDLGPMLFGTMLRGCKEKTKHYS